jgi:hypothetical protein
MWRVAWVTDLFSMPLPAALSTVFGWWLKWLWKWWQRPWPRWSWRPLLQGYSFFLFRREGGS